VTSLRVLFALVTLLPALNASAQSTQPSKKLIEFGWDEPTTAFMKQHIAEMEKRRRQRQKKIADEDAIVAARRRAPPTIVRYERHSFVINFVPFGAGQFQNGQRRKGWLFLGAEAVLGAVSVGAFATNLGLYGLAPQRRCLDPQPVGVACPPGSIDHSQEDASNTLVGVQVVSGALFCDA
jgi:hypothetical protein